jgi:CHAT domain-containing protein/Tfp pilus assembly protein PilF
MTECRPLSVRWLGVCAFALGVASVAEGGTATSATEPAGAVVESVGKGSVAEAAGLRPGDLILSWRRAASPPANPRPASGRVSSPFDLAWVEVEQAPRGQVTLEGERASTKKSWLMPAGTWKLEWLPRLPSNTREARQDAIVLLTRGHPDEALVRWQQVAQQTSMPAAAWLLSASGKALAANEATTQADRAFAAAVGYGSSLGAFVNYWLYLQWGDVLRHRSEWDGALARYRLAGKSVGSNTDQSLAGAGADAAVGAIEQARGRLEAAEECLRRALATREHLAPGSVTVARTLSSLGDLAKTRHDLELAEKYQRQAVDLMRMVAPQSLDLADSLAVLGRVILDRGDAASAAGLYRESLEMTESLAPESLEVAGILHSLGYVAWQRGDSATASQYLRRCVAIRERLAPASLELAASLTGLGAATMEGGDFATAEGCYLRSLEITERLAPDTVAVARNLNNLGNLALARGDLDAGERYHRQSLAIVERLAPGSLELALSLNNRGSVAWRRGDMATAEEFHLRSLEIRERLAPGSSAVAQSLNNLGLVAMDRGDVGAAEDFYQRALAIQEKVAPGSRDHAGSYSNLGRVAWLRGDLAAATARYRRALELGKPLGPGSRDLVALVFDNLGAVARDQRDLTSAEDYYRRALTIREELAPGGLDVAASLCGLSVVARERGDLTRAKEEASRSVTIRGRLAPGTGDEAESLNELGQVYRQSGEPDLAAAQLCRAVESLEQQKGKLGGSESAKSTFAARYASYYHDCATALVGQGKSDAAFHVLERSRARSLLAMLAERDLVFPADVPAELDRQIRLADAEYDRTQASLGELSPSKDGEKIEQALAHLRELRARQEDLAAQVRKASPRLAALKYPEPLDLAGVRSVLDEGTALLEYSVGKDETLLFVVGPPGSRTTLATYRVAIPESSLREKVRAFRALVQRKDPSDLPALAAQGAALYDLILRPAEPAIAGSERVLVSPDGPLHRLPFSALVRRDRRRREQYVAEWRPVHVVVSATVYAELERHRPASLPPAARLVAFGDPSYPSLEKEAPAKIADGEVRAIVRGGFGFAPLPASRKEVEQIASLYPQSAQTYLGPEATEEKVKTLGKDTKYLHFATHGYVNERFPLDSALVLTIPEKLEEGHENGLLQAWEVFERVRIDADLVTLSACETGLGKEMGGEGLVGLTRAFQYAGARSVLASLWSVSDESTARLMTSVYRHLKAGQTKDEALRLAQVEAIRSRGGDAHPFHWAAFEMIGDWR